MIAYATVIFAIALCGLVRSPSLPALRGVFRRRRPGMDQHSGYAEHGGTDSGSGMGSSARDFNVRAGFARRLALGSAIWGAVASNAGLHFTLTLPQSR